MSWEESCIVQGRGSTHKAAAAAAAGLSCLCVCVYFNIMTFDEVSAALSRLENSAVGWKVA